MPRERRQYPAAERLDLAEKRHGTIVSDPYRWLEDQSSPRTAAWMAGQEELLAAQRAGWLTDNWRQMLASLIAVDVVSPPTVRRGGAVFHPPPGGGGPPAARVCEGRPGGPTR